MTEDARRQRNAEMLDDCDHVFGLKLAIVLAKMEAQGYRPRIQQSWRSVEEQRALHAAGRSHVMWGFHNVTGPNGEPQALAADVLDDDEDVS